MSNKIISPSHSTHRPCKLEAMYGRVVERRHNRHNGVEIIQLTQLAQNLANNRQDFTPFGNIATLQDAAHKPVSDLSRLLLTRK